MRRRLPPALLSGLLGVAGGLHFAVPGTYASIVPRLLGNPRAWVYASGVAELACAVAVGIPRTRRAGALAAAALFVAVFPANVQMALDSGNGRPGLAHNRVVAYSRLPLQVPLVAWALAVAASARPRPVEVVSP